MSLSFLAHAGLAIGWFFVLSTGSAGNARAQRAAAGAGPALELAQASIESCSYERYIALTVADGFDLALAGEVRKDLAAELSSRGFGVCASRAGQGELVAEVVLHQRDAALVAIQVEDYTTGKRVGRDVRLGKIPPGGIALALAIATDELLRASWAELMLRRQAEAREADANAVRAAHVEPVAAPREPSPALGPSTPPRVWALGLFVGYAHTAFAWDSFGLSARASARPWRLAWAELAVGGTLALDVDTALGTARARGLFGALTLGLCGEPARLLTLCGGVRTTAQWTQFRGQNARDAQARKSDLTAVVVSAVAQLAVRLTPRLRVLGELTLGGAPLAARATDGDETLIGIDGLVVSTALGLGLSL